MGQHESNHFLVSDMYNKPESSLVIMSLLTQGSALNIL